MFIWNALPILFLLMLVASIVFAARSGGTTERKGAAIMLIGAVGSYIAALASQAYWSRPETGIFVVDLAVLVGMIWLSLTSDRLWTLWATASQVIGVATHVAMMIDHRVVPRAYALAQPFWAYPALLSLACGTAAYRKRVLFAVATASF